LFFVCYGLAEGAALGLITLLLRGSGKDRRRRRSAAYMAATAAFGAVPAGTFLARLVPWPQLPHPNLPPGPRARPRRTGRANL